ncbi:hypothetical protein COCON_G00042420 [Conger conger]|uniref:ABC transmembrane type-1 domain-containing protein n=1 Tax=Conger conger TaxID=82655 RepID=A0A9Q1DTY8_CONCO|nr:hypothetical protein COCON_G00042420 [Conger conger]
MHPDVLESVGRVEGLSLSSPQTPPEPEEEEVEAEMMRAVKRKGRYRKSLQLLKPFRVTHKHQHPVDNAGLFSFMTLHWLTPLALRAYRTSGLSMEDVWGLSCHEASETNCQRLETLWHEELKARGKEKASLARVCWRFCQTRMLVAIFSLLITMVAGFIGPALLVRALLEYSQSPEPRVLFGLSLVGGVFLMELARSWSLALVWAVNYRTAVRLRGATLTFAFQKILRLRSTKDISAGELVNMCSSDGQRIFEATTMGCLLAGGPLVAILGLSYTCTFLGPTALVGSAIFIFFYPSMTLASRLTAYFRKKCLLVSDRRVRLMNEILSSIKAIKMYCWESAFAHNIHQIRSKERKILEQAGSVQSLTVGVAPIVVVIASVCTFTLHMALGYDLTAAEAFTVVAVFNSMTFALKVTPLAVRSLSEGSVAVKRFQRKALCRYAGLGVFGSPSQSAPTGGPFLSCDSLHFLSSTSLALSVTRQPGAWQHGANRPGSRRPGDAGGGAGGVTAQGAPDWRSEVQHLRPATTSAILAVRDRVPTSTASGNENQEPGVDRSTTQLLTTACPPLQKSCKLHRYTHSYTESTAAADISGPISSPGLPATRQHARFNPAPTGSENPNQPCASQRVLPTAGQAKQSRRRKRPQITAWPTASERRLFNARLCSPDIRAVSVEAGHCVPPGRALTQLAEATALSWPYLGDGIKVSEPVFKSAPLKAAILADLAAAGRAPSTSAVLRRSPARLRPSERAGAESDVPWHLPNTAPNLSTRCNAGSGPLSPVGVLWCLRSAVGPGRDGGSLQPDPVEEGSAEDSDSAERTGLGAGSGGSPRELPSHPPRMTAARPRRASTWRSAGRHLEVPGHGQTRPSNTTPTSDSSKSPQTGLSPPESYNANTHGPASSPVALSSPDSGKATIPKSPTRPCPLRPRDGPGFRPRNAGILTVIPGVEIPVSPPVKSPILYSS